MRPQLLVVMCGVLCSGGLSQAGAQAAPPGTPRIVVPDTLDRYVEREMRERHIPGLALAIVRNGEILHQRGYGLADVADEVPVTPETRFELASITKQFTASAVMLLVQEGRIDLDGSITHYLPEAPKKWEAITVRHLMTHTSGLPPMASGFSGIAGGIYNRVRIPADVGYAAVRADSLHSRPGERFAYSDVGYYLLGMMVQHVSGVPYVDFVRERLFEPAGMSATFIHDQLTPQGRVARGYTLRDGTLINLHRPWRFDVPSHGIAVFSTVGDLARWDAALYADTPLTAASRREMWNPVGLADGTTHPYGFGWEVHRLNGQLLLRHTGITGTEMVRVPGDSVTVIVLTNLGQGFGGTVRAWGIARRVAEMLVPEIGRPPEAAPPRSTAGTTTRRSPGVSAHSSHEAPAAGLAGAPRTDGPSISPGGE